MRTSQALTQQGQVLARAQLAQVRSAISPRGPQPRSRPPEQAWRTALPNEVEVEQKLHQQLHRQEEPPQEELLQGRQVSQLRQQQLRRQSQLLRLSQQLLPQHRPDMMALNGLRLVLGRTQFRPLERSKLRVPNLCRRRAAPAWTLLQPRLSRHCKWRRKRWARLRRRSLCCLESSWQGERWDQSGAPVSPSGVPRPTTAGRLAARKPNGNSRSLSCRPVPTRLRSRLPGRCCLGQRGSYGLTRRSTAVRKAALLAQMRALLRPLFPPGPLFAELRRPWRAGLPQPRWPCWELSCASQHLTLCAAC